MSAILEGLNDRQREAVLHGEGPLLIFAGAGSGKTRVLTHRIAHLIGERGVPPHAILAVTFTNKAAEEMAVRAQALLGEQGPSVWISTFHSACVRILRRFGDRIGIERNFVIYDERDQLAMIKACMRAAGLDEREAPPASLRYLLDQSKNRLVDVSSLLGSGDPRRREGVLRFMEVYASGMRTNNALDFGDLLVMAIRLLTEVEQAREHYRSRLRHILVDEYQDTNRAQLYLIKALLGPRTDLCVVGDDDQSIYRWRGADLSNILEFESQFPEVTVVILEQNYRSTGIILEAASHVVAKNIGRRRKKLFTDRGEGEPITIYRADDEFNEARYVVSQMAQMARSGGRRWSDFAVFYRTNAQSRVFEDELRRENMPYSVIGGMKFYERKEVKDVLSYMRLAVNPSDSVAALRVINVPARGIGQTTIGRISDRADRDQTPFMKAARSAVENGDLNARSGTRVSEFLEMMEKIAERVSEDPPSDLAALVLEKTGYLAALEKEETVEAESRIENLKELVSSIQEFEERNPEAGIQDYLEMVSLFSDPDSFDGRVEAVCLMTLHCAKGLEFPVVFMVGMEEGLFPHHRSMENAEEIEEERRLCYVGITRAKDRLFITRSMQRRSFGQPQVNRASRFLADIPRTLVRSVETEAPRRESDTGWKYDYSMSQEQTFGDAGAFSEDEDDPLPVGAVVRHPKFGEGVVIFSEGKGEKQKVAVRFERAGVRTLLVHYAPLERI